MTKLELQERINKVEEKIKKEVKNKDKYYNKLSIQAKRIVNANEYLNWKEREKLDLSWEDKCNIDSYYTKVSNIRDFTVTLDKYKNQIKALDDLIEIPVLREFLNNWKENTIEYYIELTDKYIEKRKEINDKYVKNGIIIREYSKQYEEEMRELKEIFGNYVTQIVYYYRRTKNDQIKKDIEKEAQNKYKKLINRISEIVGEITNCNNLRIAGNGEINGVIEGSKGKASIETIVAGGYNDNIIVNVRHGQCAHYRVLVKELN